MTMWMQQLAAGALVVAALGHLLWRLRRRWYGPYGPRRAGATGCSACDGCRGCAPARPAVRDPQ